MISFQSAKGPGFDPQWVYTFLAVTLQMIKDFFVLVRDSCASLIGPNQKTIDSESPFSITKCLFGRLCIDLELWKLGFVLLFIVGIVVPPE